jgi:hypothetical protein
MIIIYWRFIKDSFEYLSTPLLPFLNQSKVVQAKLILKFHNSRIKTYFQV